MWRKLSKYGVIGVLNAVIDFMIYIMLIKYFHAYPLLAHIVAWCVAVQFSYMMNSLITFEKSLKQTLTLTPWFKFILSGLAALSASSLVLYISLGYFSVYMAKIIAIIASYAVGFILSQYIVFKEE